MKRTFISILSLLYCLTAFPVHCRAADGEILTKNGLVYTRKTSASDDYWLITGCEGVPEDYQLTIPAEIGGVPVRAQDSSFRGYLSVKSFVVDPDNEQLCSVDGVLFSKDMTTLYRYPPLREGEYVIPDSVTDAGWAFEDCIRLTALTIPDSVTEEIEGFGDCRALTEISGAFYISTGNGLKACSKLRNLHIEAPNVFGTQRFWNLNCYAWEDLESIVIGKNCSLEKDLLIRQCPSLNIIDFSQALAKGEEYCKANVLVEDCASLTKIALPPTEDPNDWGNFEISNCSGVETIQIYGNWWMKLTDCPDAVIYGYQDNSYLQSCCETSGQTFIPFGDTNADQMISILDVLTLNRNLLIGEPLHEQGRNAADYNGDGIVSQLDSLCILRSTIGM